VSMLGARLTNASAASDVLGITVIANPTVIATAVTVLPLPPPVNGPPAPSMSGQVTIAMKLQSGSDNSIAFIAGAAAVVMALTAVALCLYRHRAPRGAEHGNPARSAGRGGSTPLSVAAAAVKSGTRYKTRPAMTELTVQRIRSDRHEDSPKSSGSLHAAFTASPDEGWATFGQLPLVEMASPQGGGMIPDAKAPLPATGDLDLHTGSTFQRV